MTPAVLDRIEGIAKVAHEALDAYREVLGEKPVGHWEHTDAKHREAFKDGIRLALHGATPRALHEFAVTNPNAGVRAATVPYAQLPEEQQKKAVLVQAVAQSLGCGIERWDVKTGTDPNAGSVNETAKPSTIAELVAFPAPPPDPPQRVPGEPECQVYTIVAHVDAVKEEADSDFHLALSDGQGNTMIAEVPCPGCCGSSPWLADISAARSAVTAAMAAAGVAQIGPDYSEVSLTATITGVGFFDRIHGQRGVAPNGIELHPVRSITFDPPTGVGG